MSVQFPIQAALTVGVVADANRDNQISQDELKAYKSTIKTQSDFYNAHITYRNDLIKYYEANRGIFGAGVDPLIEQIKNQIKTLDQYVGTYKQHGQITDFFTSNYDFMAKQDATGSWGTQLKGNEKTLSFNDIYITAQKSAPANQLGSEDITPATTPNPTPTPAPADTQVILDSGMTITSTKSTGAYKLEKDGNAFTFNKSQFQQVAQQLGKALVPGLTLTLGMATYTTGEKWWSVGPEIGPVTIWGGDNITNQTVKQSYAARATLQADGTWKIDYQPELTDGGL